MTKLSPDKAHVMAVKWTALPVVDSMRISMGSNNSMKIYKPPAPPEVSIRFPWKKLANRGTGRPGGLDGMT
jgi:hypothetical protein